MSAHDLPDTPEVREKMAAAQADSMVRMGLTSSTVEPWEDGFRSHDDQERSFEWWYFDMQFDDGSTVVATFNTKPHVHPDGPLEPSILLIHHGPDGERTRVSVPFPVTEFAASTDRCDVRIGPNTVSGDLARYDLHLEHEGLVVDLRLDRGTVSWRPGAGVSYFDSAKTRFLAWVVPVPYGTVTGTITSGGGTREVTGTGYHDHNWGNRLMSDMLDHWFWGRAHVGDYTVVYVRMTTKGLFGLGAINLPTFFLAKGDVLLTDDLIPLRLETHGDVPGPGGQAYPSHLRWSWQTSRGTVRMHVTNPSMIEALDMLPDMPAWRRTLVHAFEHPMYYDFTADIELSIDLAADGDVPAISDTVTGRTLYEKMMFR